MAHVTPDEPELPEYLAYLWTWFWELAGRRKSGMSGPEPIGYSDIWHWAQLTCNDPTPQEVAILVAVDMAYIAAGSDKENDDKDTKQATRLEKPPE